jgi:hypothetical protein
MTLSLLSSQMDSFAMMVLIRLIRIELHPLLVLKDVFIELLVHMIKNQEQSNKI